MSPKARKEIEVPDEQIQKRSVADFFQENKAIAGFDNPMRSVFTSIRELVENALDAAEKIGRLPDVEVHIERVSMDEIQSLLGIKSLERLDKKVDFLRLRVRDNGSGVPDDLIPMLFGRVLTGSNYGARQTRGRFGLGAKMVLIYAMSTVDLPIKVTSRYLNEDTTSYYELLIDLGKNEPIIVTHELWGPDDARALPHSGTEVEVTFTGNWNLASRYVREYFHQLAMITPYARFVIHYPGDEHPVIYERVVDDMPPYPKLGKIHPWGCDITQFKREIAATRTRDMKTFLLEHFQGFNSRNVLKFLEYVNIDANKDPKKLKASEIRRIVHEGFRPPEKRKRSSPKAEKGKEPAGFRFTKPKADSLSPLGAKNLEWGVRKELDPDFVVSEQGEPKAYSGHPFIVEAAVAYGGSILAEHARKTRGPKIYRFANRIPLLFGQGEDVITKVIKDDIDWSKYGVNPDRDSIAIVVSIVSTKIPFPETSKEYIADVPEIRAEIRRVLNVLLRELKRHVGRIKRERRERERQSMYVSAARAVVGHLRAMLTDTNSPINLAEPLTAEIVETALASAEKKIIKRQYPLSKPLWRIPEWLDTTIEKKLRVSGINTIYQFLAADSSELSKITGLSMEKIKTIKRNSVIRGNFEGLSPNLSNLELVPSEVEKDFETYLGMPRILKAFSRRWIVSGFDFAAATIDHLLSVEGLVPKLVHLLKKDLIQTYPRPKKTEQQDAMISFDLIPWMTEDVKKELRKLGISNVGEYMIAPIAKLAKSRELTLAIMKYEKSLVHQLIEQGHMDRGQPVLHDTFRWTNSEIRSRLRSKGVQSIENFLQVDEEILIDEELIRESLARISKQDLLDFLSNEMDFTPVEILPWMTPEILKEFMKPPVKLGTSKIDNIPLFLITDDQDLARLPRFSRWLASKFHREVIKKLEGVGGHHDITNLLWLDLDIEKTLLLHEIETVFDFIRTLPSELKEIVPQLDSGLVTTIKKKYGTSLDYLAENARKILAGLGISVLEEFYYNPDLETLLLAGDKASAEILRKEREWLNYPSCFLPLPSRYSHFLLAMGIATVGQFLTWPMEEIKGPGAPPKALLQRAREHVSSEILIERYSRSFYPSTMLNALVDQLIENQQEYLATLQKTSRSGQARLKNMKKMAKYVKIILSDDHSLVDLYYDLKSGNDDKIRDILATNNKKLSPEDIEKLLLELRNLLLSVLEAPLCLFENIAPESIEPLSRQKIKRFIDMYIWDERELADILSKDLSQVRALKTDLGKLRNGTPLKGLGIISERILSALVDRGYATFEDLYFKADESTFAMSTVRWRDMTRFLRTLDSPLVFFVMKPQKDLLDLKQALKSLQPSLEGLEQKKVSRKSKKTESDVKEEIKSLEEKIEEAEKQVESIPSVFRESGKYHAFVEKLAENGIDTVIKFLYWPNHELALMTGVSESAIQYWKENFELKETGVPLEYVSGLSTAVLRSLKEQLDITTVEGLYFLVNEDLLEDTDISWEEVRKPIEALELPLGFIRPYLREEYYQAWKKKRIDKILRFVITSDEELAQIINRTADVVFLLKQSLYEKITLYQLREIAEVVLNLFSQISHEQLSILLENEITTVYDFLTTDNAMIAAILSLTENEVDALKETFTIDEVSKVKEAVSIELKELKGIQAPDTLKLLKSLGYDSVSSFYYQLSSEKLAELTEQHPELNWEEVRITHRLLDAPIGILPSLTRETVDLLIKRDVTSVIMFLTLPTSTIASYLSLTEDEALKLKKSVNIEEIVRTLSGFPVEVILPKEHEHRLPDLKAAGINSVLDLIVSDISTLCDLFNLDESTLHDFLLELSYSDLYGLLAVPINMLGVLDESQEKLLRKARIRTAGDFLLTSEEKIATILQLNVEDVRKIKNRIDYGSIVKSLQIPLTVFPDFQDVHLLQKLQHHRIFTLRDFYLQSDSDLAAILGSSKSKIRKLKQELKISQVRGKVSTEQWNVESYPSLFDENMVAKLHDNGIKTIQEFVTALKNPEMVNLNISEDQKESYRELLSLSVSLIPHFTSTQVKSLLKSGIRSIGDILLKPDSMLATILDVPPEDVRNFKAGISMELLENKKATLQLTDVLVIEAPILAALEEHGITTIDDAFYAELTALELPISAQKYLERLQLAFTRPVVFLKRHLPPRSILELALHGIVTIYDFLKADQEFLTQFGITEEHVTEIRRNLNLRELLENRARQLGTSLTRFPKFISENAVKALQEINCLTYEELYFLVTEEQVNKSAWNAILPVKETLDLPVCFIPEIQQSFPHKIRTLHEKGVRSIIEFIYWPNKELALILGMDRMEALSLKNNMPLAKLKSRRNKLGTPLDALPVLDANTKTMLESLGITSIESLYFAIRGKNIPPPDILPQKMREAVLKLLNSSIMLLDGVPMHKVSELKRRGVRTIIDFLYWDVAALARILGLRKKADVEALKNPIRLRKISDLTKEVDKFFKSG